ncbi:MAG TPA: glutamine synthetase, partial [bacterium]|nr:glutamine synthetase [bacterium]
MDIRKFTGKLDGIDFLDLLMLDIYGSIRHVTIPKGYITKKVLNEGIGFDASNFGFAKVHDSDMVAVPDLATGFVGMVQDKKVLRCLCDVV